jgi:hypothetical protein
MWWSKASAHHLFNQIAVMISERPLRALHRQQKGRPESRPLAPRDKRV